MKYILVSILGLLLFGCATAIPLSPNETCAKRNMKLAGIDEGHSSGTQYNYRRGTSVVNSATTSIRCDVPSNDKDTEEISKTSEIMQPKVEYNSNIKGKQLVTAIGYMAFIIPGVALKIYYDRQYDEAVKRSEDVSLDRP